MLSTNRSIRQSWWKIKKSREITPDVGSLLLSHPVCPEVRHATSKTHLARPALPWALFHQPQNHGHGAGLLCSEFTLEILCTSDMLTLLWSKLLPFLFSCLPRNTPWKFSVSNLTGTGINIVQQREVRQFTYKFEVLNCIKHQSYSLRMQKARLRRCNHDLWPFGLHHIIPTLKEGNDTPDDAEAKTVKMQAVSPSSFEDLTFSGEFVGNWVDLGFNVKLNISLRLWVICRTRIEKEHEKALDSKFRSLSESTINQTNPGL